VARGGGLLFLTNLIAITFTAMVVFLAVRLDTERVRASLLDWRRRNEESALLRKLLVRVPALERTERTGSLPVRVGTIMALVVLLLVPLSKSFGLLKQEIERHRAENRILSVGKAVWREMFVRLPTGEPRSFIEHMSVQEADGQPELFLRVFTGEPCTKAEKDRYLALVTARLHRPPGSLSLQLVEIPTAKAVLKANRREGPLPPPSPRPSVAKLSGDLERRLSSDLHGLRLPPEAEALGFEAAIRPGEPLALTLGYLADHEIGPDVAALIAGLVRDRLADGPAARVALEWCPRSFGPFRLGRHAVLTREARSLLDAAGSQLERWPALRAEIALPGAKPPAAAEKRAQAVREYLATRWRIAPERLTAVADPASRAMTLSLRLAPAAQK
jgi:hypothetical protein